MHMLPAEECRRLFPKHPTVEEKREAQAVADLYSRLWDLKRAEPREMRKRRRGGEGKEEEEADDDANENENENENANENENGNENENEDEQENENEEMNTSGNESKSEKELNENANEGAREKWRKQVSECEAEIEGRQMAIDALRKHKKKDMVGRQPDNQLLTDDGREIWLDETGVHPTAKSYVGRELKAAKANRDAWLEGKETRDWPYNGTEGRGMPCLEQARKDKRDTYASLLGIASKQFRMGRRHTNRPPEFIPTVFTSYGEVSSEFISVQEDIVAGYKRRVERDMGEGGERDDGARSSTLSALKRTEIRTSVQVLIANRVARVMRDAGYSSKLTKKRQAMWGRDREGERATRAGESERWSELEGVSKNDKLAPTWKLLNEVREARERGEKEARGRENERERESESAKENNRETERKRARERELERGDRGNDGGAGREEGGQEIGTLQSKTKAPTPSSCDARTEVERNE
jgi:hypothetical protein